MHFTGDGDAATDAIHLWHGVFNSPFRDRTPAVARNWIPASCQPRLSVNAGDRPSARETAIWRRADPAGIIRQQIEYYTAATVEPERLINPTRSSGRLPALEDAFECKVRDYPGTLRLLYDTPGVTVCPLSEYAEMVKDDLKQEGLTDAFIHIIHPVLQDVRAVCPVFFTNTTDLMSCIQHHSARYQSLTDADKQFVRNQINQPLFQVSAS